MIRITQGETVLLTNTLRNNNRPVSLAGWNVRAALRLNQESPALVECPVILQSGGVFTVSVATNANTPVGELTLSIRLQQPAGLIRTLHQRVVIVADNNW